MSTPPPPPGQPGQPQGQPLYRPPYPQPQPGAMPYAQQSPPGPYPPQPKKASNPVGVAAFVCGLVACLVVWVGLLAWLWLLTMLAAIILGIIGLVLRNRMKVLAGTGLGLGVFSILLAVIALVIGSAIATATGADDGTTVTLPTQPPAVEETATPAPVEPAPPADTRQPVVFEGQGEATTAKAALEGDYAVTWETFGDCTYFADLEDLSEELFSASAVTTGTTYIYAVPAGEYYADVITGPAPNCGWKVTLTPQ